MLNKSFDLLRGSPDPPTFQLYDLVPNHIIHMQLSEKHLVNEVDYTILLKDVAHLHKRKSLIYL